MTTPDRNGQLVRLLRVLRDLDRKVKKLRDGSVELELTCYDSPEVDAWVRSYGADVEVLEPASLRAQLAETARVLLERYARPA